MSCIKCNSYVKLRKSFQDQKICVAYTRSSYLKGARVRNCAEKDVVITVDKCRKEKRNRNSRQLMTPSISFYTSCDVTKHQPSFPFWTLDAYSRVKSVHLERFPFPHSHPLQPHAFRPRPLCVTVLRACPAYVCGKTTDIKRAYRTWNPRGFPRDEKLMAHQVPERYYYFGWWLVTLLPLPLA